MAYRRIDLLAEDLSIERIRTALDDSELNDLYLVQRDDGLLQASLILDESLTEHALDTLNKAFSKKKHFQLLVYNIEARLPQPERAKDDPEEPDTPSKKNGKARNRISRDELLDDLRAGSEVRPIYLAQVAISVIVAGIGLMRDSVALVIGAMVIAPLLLPCMSLGLATTIGDLKMMARSVWTALAGVSLGLAIALVMGLVLPFDPGVEQIAMRGETRMSDVVVALAAGAAGALAVTTGVSAALVGVMVAVALVPPVVAIGLLLGAGEYTAAGGATLLLATNLVCVNIAAMSVFLIQGIRPSRFAEERRARAAIWHAAIIWCVLLAGLVLLIIFASPKNPME